MGYMEDRERERVAWAALADAYVEYIRVRGLHVGRYTCPIDIHAANHYAGIKGTISVVVEKDGAVCRVHADGTPWESPAPPTTAPLAALVAMLWRLEWIENEWSEWWCPICDRQKDGGHTPNCQLAALLAALPIPINIPKTPRGNDGRS